MYIKNPDEVKVSTYKKHIPVINNQTGGCMRIRY